MIGLMGISMCLNGYFAGKLNPIFRVLAVFGGIGLLIPMIPSDIVGIVILGGIAAFQLIRRKKQDGGNDKQLEAAA